MSAIAPPLPATPPTAETVSERNLRRFTVTEYERMVEAGVPAFGERVELLDGFLAVKPMPNPRRSSSIDQCDDLLRSVLPPEWRPLSPGPLRLTESVPEPAIAVVRRDSNYYSDRHPTAADTAFVAEVSESSLANDRTSKRLMDAREGIPIHWVVNVVASQIEVDSHPSEGDYYQRDNYQPGDTIPVVVAGTEVARLAVADLLPAAAGGE